MKIKGRESPGFLEQKKRAFAKQKMWKITKQERMQKWVEQKCRNWWKRKYENEKKLTTNLFTEIRDLSNHTMLIYTYTKKGCMHTAKITQKKM